jgi:hypothetical protein
MLQGHPPNLLSWDLDQFIPNHDSNEVLFNSNFFNESPPLAAPSRAATSQSTSGARKIKVVGEAPNTRSKSAAKVKKIATSAAPAANPCRGKVGEQPQKSFKERRREAVRKSRSKKNLYFKNLAVKVQQLEKETEELEKMASWKILQDALKVRRDAWVLANGSIEEAEKLMQPGTKKNIIDRLVAWDAAHGPSHRGEGRDAAFGNVEASSGVFMEDQFGDGDFSAETESDPNQFEHHMQVHHRPWRTLQPTA